MKTQTNLNTFEEHYSKLVYVTIHIILGTNKTGYMFCQPPYRTNSWAGGGKVGVTPE